MSKQQPDDAMLAGKMVLVTGASRGIGRAIALACAAAGADVAVTYRTSRSAADDVAGTIRGLGRRAEVFATDASQADDVRRLAADARGALGRVDVWINNAGARSEEHTSELQSLTNLVCRLLLEKKKKKTKTKKETYKRDDQYEQI